MKRWIPIFLLCLLFSCDYFQPRQAPDSLARVGNSYLPQSELAKLGLETATPEDSTKIVNAYINNWIRSEAYNQYIKNELSESQLAEISKKVEDYQQSLYTHLYESQMIAEKLDTLISPEEIQSYYASHQQDFAVNEPIVRFLQIKKDNAFADKKEVKAWIDEYLESGNDAELKEYCTYSTISCHLNSDTWMTEKAFFETFGKNFGKEDIKLNSTALQELENEDYYYLCKILERKSSGFYPIEYVEQEIKKNVFRARENEFIENLRTQIIEQARNNNEIEIYDAE